MFTTAGRLAPMPHNSQTLVDWGDRLVHLAGPKQIVEERLEHQRGGLLVVQFGGAEPKRRRSGRT
jgi:hypothetical protein